MTGSDGLVMVATCDARHKAELLVELLEDVGIAAVLEDGEAIGFGSKPPFGPFHVAVRSNDAESAKEIVTGWWEADESD